MVDESAIAHCDRFLEALQPWRMRPELAAATGSRSATCHVLDAKYEPGVRAVILYSLGDQLVRGDLLPLPDGVRLSPFPHDPDLPTLPQLMDAGTRRPARRRNRTHARRAAALPPRQARHGAA